MEAFWDVFDSLDEFDRSTDIDGERSIARSEDPALFSTGQKSQRSDAKPSLLPDQPWKFYAEKITTALNSQDLVFLHQTLLSICTNDLQIVRRVYSLSTPDAAKLGLQDMVFRNVEEFCYYMGVWNAMVPDGIFETSFHRVCVDTPPTYVFISNLRFTGHKLLKEMDLVGDRLQDHYWHLNQFMMIQMRKNPCPVQSVVTGSLSVFVSKDGKVERIELYLNRQ